MEFVCIVCTCVNNKIVFLKIYVWLRSMNHSNLKSGLHACHVTYLLPPPPFKISLTMVGSEQQYYCTTETHRSFPFKAYWIYWYVNNGRNNGRGFLMLILLSMRKRNRVLRIPDKPHQI